MTKYKASSWCWSLVKYKMCGVKVILCGVPFALSLLNDFSFYKWTSTACDFSPSGRERKRTEVL